MYRVTLSKPSTFLYNGIVKIYNLDGSLFYEKRVKNYFNLPKGSFLSNIDLLRLKHKNFIYKQIINKKPERNEKPQKFIFTYGNNPNKVTIHRPSGKLYIDQNFWNNINELEKRFVLLHEFAHYTYNSELPCDIFAANRLMKSGYNLSQVAKCSNSSLSDKKARVLPLINHLKNAK